MSRPQQSLRPGVRAVGLLWLGLFFVAACQSRPSVSDGLYDTYGDGNDVRPEEAVAVDALVADPAPHLRETITVEGTVAEVCQVKGCWLVLGDDVRVFVAKTDSGAYRFTVPKDISGRRALVRGWLEAKTLGEEEQRHMAEDAGEPAPQELRPRRELQLTAAAILVAKQTE